jgi:uncharacterized membrane protein
MSVSKGSRWPGRVVWIGAIVYAVVLTVLSVKRLHDFHAGYDLAIFDQLTWLLGHFHDPFSTVRGRAMLADHFEPGLAVLAPIGALSAGPWLLLAAQSVGLAAAAPVLFAIARTRGADPLLAVAVALLWLASPLTQQTNLFDFHPEAFVPLLFALSVLGLARSSNWLFVVSGVLAASVKEDVALTYAALGLGIVLIGRPRFGAAVAAAGAVWFALATTVGIDVAGGSLTYYSQRFGGGTSASVGQVLRDFVRHPIRGLGTVSFRLNVKMVVGLVGSTVGLCLLGAEILVAAVPSVAVNLLSRYPQQHYLTLQYHIVPAGVCAAAAAWGVSRVPTLRGRWRIAVVAATAAACALFLVLSPGVHVARGRYSDSPHDAPGVASARRAALRLIPSGVPVAVQYDAVAYVAERRDVYAFPEPFVRAAGNGENWSVAELRRRAAQVRYVLVDDGPTFPASASDARDVRSRLKELGFRLVFAREGVKLYRR